MKYLLIIFVLFISGCASVKSMRGTEAQQTSGEDVSHLKITAEGISSLSIENYRMIKVYFRNLNENWLRVKSIEVTEVEGSPNFQVILGKDLVSWRKSMELDFDLKKEKAIKDKAPTAELDSLRAELANYKNEDHLYEPLSLPSNLQTQKWILLQIPKTETIKGFTFVVRHLDDRQQTYRVVIGGQQ
ncbi:MAG: hypothetical protein H6624_12450 [Bdellovibrionaceae bacterium]|nr:hypothetical protein [Pseudobdellovibrionaceae bacterium]